LNRPTLKLRSYACPAQKFDSVLEIVAVHFAPPSFTRALVLNVLLLVVFSAASRAADQVLTAGDSNRGTILFQQTCALCHATGLEKRLAAGQGPLLAGVVGRPAASLPNFGYTKALKSSHLTWDAATLDRFLAGPTALVPGTNMVIPVANPADRRDLLAFLATLRPIIPPTHRVDISLLHHVPTPGDWQNDHPGVLHRIRLENLPSPYATLSAGNAPHTVDRPAGATLSVPAGFQVKLFASGLSGPRLLRIAPNGDIFIAENRRGRIRVLRAADGADAPSENTIFADNLEGPFGIGFYPLGGNPQWVYVANLNSVVRFPYHNGDLKARGPAETVVAHLADTTSGHTSRDIAFSLDGRRMFISIGSGSNVADGMPEKSPAEIQAWQTAHALGSAWGYEANRADIMETDPEGRRSLKIFATGIRNPVGLAIQPATGELWASVNERDALGDDLVPDYITRVREGGFYGWPWYYMGNHEDPRHAGERPDLAGHVIAPDVPVQSHSASLEMTFYPANASGPAAFPAEYSGDVFAAFHGSWNRTGRTGSKVVRVRLRNGVPTGDYEDFLTGFVIDDSHVWGRPVGVAIAHDGALLVTDDANDTLWRISYTGR
jgi:glucose/arabinose dehydrogenase/cytochrome c2